MTASLKYKCTVRNAWQEIKVSVLLHDMQCLLLGRAKWGRFGEVWIIQKFKICTRLSRRRATEEPDGNLYVSRLTTYNIVLNACTNRSNIFFAITNSNPYCILTFWTKIDFNLYRLVIDYMSEDSQKWF